MEEEAETQGAEDFLRPRSITRANSYPIAGRTEAKIEAETVTYTSLRDVLPPSMASPTSAAQEPSMGGAAIRNPLVMQAALAYLQPAGLGGGDRRRRGGGMGWHEHGCIGCFNGVVLAVFRMVLGRGKGGDDEDEDEDEDEEDYAF